MPIKVFGEGAGQIGGDHKDTTIVSTILGISEATVVVFQTRELGAGGRSPLLRFSLVGHIPTNAIINSAVLTTTLQTAPASNLTIGLYRMITQWGVDLTNEGVSENPATGGQASWRRSFDFNGAGGDVTWAGGGNISAVDYAAVETTYNVLAADAPGTVYNINIPIMVQNWVSSDANNAGLIMRTTAGSFNIWANQHSQEAVVAANRPYLTVDYTVPSSSSSSSSCSSSSSSSQASAPGVLLSRPGSGRGRIR